MLYNFSSDYFHFTNDLLFFIKKYRGCTFVIKYGGSVMKDESLKLQVIQDICFLYYLGIKIILVHGGGPFINSWLSKLNIEPKFENGIRVTDHITMEVVEMVLVGKINKELVSLLNSNGIASIGLSGKDANLITASPLLVGSNNLVGKIDKINNNSIKLLLSNNYIPVISSVASDSNSNTYNVNADTAAACIASSLNAEKLILLTDASGVMVDINDPSTLIKNLNIKSVKQLQKNKSISGGMIPKLDGCLKSLQEGVKAVHIIDGKIKNSLLYETLTKERIGSMITL